MKVAIFSATIGTHAGGPEVYEKGLINGLAAVDKANQYVVYCLDTEASRTLNLNSNFEFRILKPSVSPISRWIQIPISLPWQLWRNPPDLLHVPYVGPPVMPRKSVYSLLCYSMFSHPEFYPPAIRWRITRACTIGCTKASMVICVSNYIRDNLIDRFRLSPDRVFTSYPGVDRHFTYMPDKERVRERLKKLGIHGPYILYVGKVQKRKNPERLVQAFYMLKQETKIEHKLLLVGRKFWGSGYDAADVDSLIQRYRLQEEVLHIDPFPRSELPYLYNGADLLSFPSLYEGFGLPPLEALACGTPVVTSDCTSLPEAVGDAALLVDPYKVEEIASAMYELIRDEKLRSRLVEKGLERAKAFTWEKTATETLEIYRRVYNDR